MTAFISFHLISLLLSHKPLYETKIIIIFIIMIITICIIIIFIFIISSSSIIIHSHFKILDM